MNETLASTVEPASGDGGVDIDFQANWLAESSDGRDSSNGSYERPAPSPNRSASPGPGVSTDHGSSPGACASADHAASPDSSALFDQGLSADLAASPVSSAPAVRVGCVIRDRYVLEERLGIGSRGTVFKALDRYRLDLPEEDRYVAIKVRHPGADHREDLLADLRREFYCAQTLSHESVVNVYQLDRDGDIDFFTMELLEGELLSSVMAELHAPMSRPQAWAIIRDIASGVAHAHSRNVIHADLKPDNIMITHSGEVRILDFSNAVGHFAEDVVHRRSPLSAGTRSYASCELLAGRAPDPRDDLYALACLSYELLSGEHPFQRRPATEARTLGIVPKRPPGLTRQQWQTLAMGLSWHRGGRPTSVRAWLNKMNIERVAARRVPGVRGLQPAPAAHADRGTAAPLRATALFLVLLMTVGVWVSFVRWASGSRATGHDAVPELMANQPNDRGPASPLNQPDWPNRSDLRFGEAPVTAGLGGVPVDLGGRRSASSTTPPQDSPKPLNIKLSGGRARDAGRPKHPPAADRPLLGSAGNYTVRSGEHFAEIRVHRSSLLPKDAEFVWWTEAASAKPGIDYVHQGKVTQHFPKGKDSASFFIKLLPGASRARREVFYVAIAPAGRNAAADPVARAAVWLPMNQDRSQSAAAPDAAAAERDAHSASDARVDSSFNTAALGSPLPNAK
ncbi:MAG TPA: serine/threonine-protein kinase [Steroidobacteraceae bacterium]|nr:serine/threonine-protein kinase [Steroidobacteraceae bacterium]